MSDTDAVERRLAAVERALVDGDADLDGLSDAAAIAAAVERHEATLADLEARIADLEASTLALRGYVGNVRSVNEAVERRADSAVATTDRLERRVETLEAALETEDESAVETRSASGSVDLEGRPRSGSEFARTGTFDAGSPDDRADDDPAPADGESRDDAALPDLETDDAATTAGDGEGLLASVRRTLSS